MIQRVLTFFLIISIQLFAESYDSNIISIEAKLFPKIALLEKHIQEKKLKSLNINIISKEIDFNLAHKFSLEIQNSYPEGLAGKNLSINIVDFENYELFNPDIIIVLYSSEKKLQEVSTWANQNKILSFIYDPSYIKYGFLASIYIGKSTKPYLNSDIIREYGFKFDSYLLSLSKFRP